MFTKKDSSGFKPLIPGVQYRPLVYGQLTLLCEFLLEKGHQIPLHHHIYEQTGFLISGEVIFRIGEEVYETHPGDSWCIPENVPHSVEILEDALVVELFSPPRPDYMPLNPE
jgi:quercetin dioxygenase-like cupin family protein